ncbi:nuclear transport factor 2 family protein [Parahaliea maris]|uniref:Nuclear transport factor 2 family protein n=1 Tax=Parahaliea maris TaxID=2716870 RepID=A0A5C8ZP66_9GAMM|nr:nuclear transport factor 2 family protein [Parahaliea maris]TXS90278.1 nuclear transport factor 2 family protein [Parahaliea maris]
MIKHCKNIVAVAIASALLASGCAMNDTPSSAGVSIAEDVHAIQNVMSRHGWYYSSGQHKRELEELFALDHPDVSWGNGYEYWVGKDLLWDYYVTYFDQFRKRDLVAFAEQHPGVEVTHENLGAGTSMFHTNSTPVIEVAKDGKSAKGIWYSIGQVTQTPGGRQSANYMWERYGVDFIKVDGEWRILHFTVLTDWAASPGNSWAADDRKGGGMGGPGMGPPPAGVGAGNADAQMAGQAGESGGAPKPNCFGNGEAPSLFPGPGGIEPVKQDPLSGYEPPSEILFIPQPYATWNDVKDQTYGCPNSQFL